MRETITKNTLAKKIFCDIGIPVTMAQDILDDIFKTIIQFTAQDGSTKISNFGSFYVKNKNPRLSRNLNTNESVMIDARKVVSFHPSNQLKQIINEDNKA